MLRLPVPIDRAVSWWSLLRPDPAASCPCEDNQARACGLSPLEGGGDGGTGGGAGGDGGGGAGGGGVGGGAGDASLWENELHTVEVVKRDGEYHAVVDGRWFAIQEGGNATASVPRHKELSINGVPVPAPLAFSLCVDGGEDYPERCHVVVKQRIVVDGQEDPPIRLFTFEVETRSAADPLSMPTVLPYPIANTPVPHIELLDYHALYVAEQTFLSVERRTEGAIDVPSAAPAGSKPHFDAKWRSSRGIPPMERRNSVAWNRQIAAHDEPIVSVLPIDQLANEVWHIARTRSSGAEPSPQGGKTVDQLARDGRKNASTLLQYILTGDKESTPLTLQQRLERAYKENVALTGIVATDRAETPAVYVQIVYELIVTTRKGSTLSIEVEASMEDAVDAGYIASGYRACVYDFHVARMALQKQLQLQPAIAAATPTGPSNLVWDVCDVKYGADAEAVRVKRDVDAQFGHLRDTLESMLVAQRKTRASVQQSIKNAKGQGRLRLLKRSKTIDKEIQKLSADKTKAEASAKKYANDIESAKDGVERKQLRLAAANLVRDIRDRRYTSSSTLNLLLEAFTAAAPASTPTDVRELSMIDAHVIDYVKCAQLLAHLEEKLSGMLAYQQPSVSPANQREALVRQTSPAIVVTGSVQTFSLAAAATLSRTRSADERVAAAIERTSSALGRCTRLYNRFTRDEGAASLVVHFDRFYECKDVGDLRRLLSPSRVLRPTELPSTCLFSATVAPQHAYDAEYTATLAGGAWLEHSLRVASGPASTRYERHCRHLAESVMAELVAVCLLSRSQAGIDPMSRASLASRLGDDARNAAYVASTFISQAYDSSRDKLVDVYLDHPCFSCVPGFEYVRSALTALGLLKQNHSPPLVIGQLGRGRKEQLRLVALELRRMAKSSFDVAALPFPCSQSALMLLPSAARAATGEARTLPAHSRALALSLSRLKAATDACNACNHWNKQRESVFGSLLVDAAMAHPCVVATYALSRLARYGTLPSLQSFIEAQCKLGSTTGFAAH